MPYLRAALKKKEIKEEPQEEPQEEYKEVRIESVLPPEPRVISNIRPVNDVPLPEDIQIPLSLFIEESNTTDTTSTTQKKVNTTAKGRKYEEYVGSLYKKEGYIVIYNGRDSAGGDGGIDLICKKGNYTVLVQCKCYTTGSVTSQDMCYLYGASHRYVFKYPREVVQRAFWTTRPISQTSSAFRTAIELGILLYET